MNVETVESTENVDVQESEESENPTVTNESEELGESDVEKTMRALKAQREIAKKASKRNKELTDKLETLTSQIKDVDVEKYHQMLEREAQAEELKMIQEGKQAEVQEKKLEAMKNVHKKEVEELKGGLSSKDQEIASLKMEVLKSQVEAGVSILKYDEIIDDAKMHAMSLFTLNENNKAVMMDGDDVILGIDGKTPMSPRDWVNSEAIRDKKSHWFVMERSGSGAFQTSQGKNGKKTISREKFLNLSPAEQRSLHKSGVIPVD